MILDNEVVHPKLYTGVKYCYELDELLVFPLKINDLSPLSRISIQIFDMDRTSIDDDEGELIPIASTVIDLFDS